MKFNLYSFWMDPWFYLASGVFALSVFLLVFSIRKYLELKNGSDFEAPSEEAGAEQAELPMPEEDHGVRPPGSDPITPRAAVPRADGASKAEEFVKGIYQNMASLDARLKNIEAALSKTRVNRDFTVTFIEDMIADFDGLDKEKIKARLQYLVEDLKKG